MLKAIIVGAALVLAMNASALPKGKPFQELAAQISSLDAEIAGLQQRIEDGDTALTEAIAALAEQVAENTDSIASIDDVLEQLAIETGDLATAVGTTKEALASLALDMAEQIAALKAADEALADRLEVLEAIAHANVTGECEDGSVLVGLTETTITCESIQQSSNPIAYRRNVEARSASPTRLVVLPECDEVGHRSYNGGFLASPDTARVTQNFLRFSEVPRADRRQIVADNATRLVGYMVCERPAA